MDHITSEISETDSARSEQRQRYRFRNQNGDVVMAAVGIGGFN
jgi:hypothetical protein